MHISLDYQKNGIPFRPEWNDHSIPSEMRPSIPTGMEWLHSIFVVVNRVIKRK
jgi:hypothetical protein